MQQRTLLRDKDNLTNPRDDVINDICRRIRKDVNDNKSVILMGDFNEGVDLRDKTHEKLSDIGLVNLLYESVGPNLPKTWNRGATAIDHVYSTVDVHKSVRKAGYSPFNTICMSDHRSLFFDLDMRVLFDEQLHHNEPAHFRKMQSSNLKRVREYHKYLKKNGITIRWMRDYKK